MDRGGQLQKKFRDRVTILGVELKGPNKFSLEEQIDRTGGLKINLCNNTFWTTCRLRGLRNPKKPIILKKVNRDFLHPI